MVLFPDMNKLVNSPAVISLISLCQSEGNPPLLQLQACWTENVLQQIHSIGRYDNCQPYRKETASRKALYGRRNQVLPGEIRRGSWKQLLVLSYPVVVNVNSQPLENDCNDCHI